MTRELRQEYITKMMVLGKTFEEVYKESDGIPYFTWWIYEPKSQTGYLETNMTLEQVNAFVDKNCPKGTTYHKELKFGYTIDL